MVSLPSCALAFDSAIGVLLQRRRQTSGVENIDQKIDFRFREVAGDLSVVGDRALNVRGRFQHIVKNDAQLIFETTAFVGQVVASQFAE